MSVGSKAFKKAKGKADATLGFGVLSQPTTPPANLWPREQVRAWAGGPVPYANDGYDTVWPTKYDKSRGALVLPSVVRNWLGGPFAVGNLGDFIFPPKGLEKYAFDLPKEYEFPSPYPDSIPIVPQPWQQTTPKNIQPLPLAAGNQNGSYISPQNNWMGWQEYQKATRWFGETWFDWLTPGKPTGVAIPGQLREA